MQEVTSLEVERSQPKSQMQVNFTLWGPAIWWDDSKVCLYYINYHEHVAAGGKLNVALESVRQSWS